MTVKEYANIITDRYTESTYKKLKIAIENSNKTIKRKLKEFVAEFGDGTNMDKFEMMKYNRFNKLLEQYNELLKELEKNKYKLIKDSNVETYREVFNLNRFDVYQSLGLELNFSKINQDTVLLAIENPIKDLKLEELVRKNRTQNINIINNLLSQQILAGNSYKETAENLNKIFSTDLYKMQRIVRTENHRVKNIANRQSVDEIAKKYKRAVVYTWNSSEDERVRTDHNIANGQTIKQGELFQVGLSRGEAPGNLFGSDSASQNINCRCFLTEKIGDKLIESEYNTKKYNDWKNNDLQN